jgi:HlyD family secretion protein
MKTLLVILLVLLLAGGGFGLWYLNAAGNSGSGFRTAAVERGDLRATINATGTLQPEEAIDVGAQVAGQIKEFGRDPDDSKKPIDFASRVEDGTVLAKIDDAKYAARVEQSQFRLEQAKAKVEQARSQVEQARANQKRAEADLQNVRSKLNQAERDWERIRKLRGTTAFLPQEYDAAEAAYEVAKSGLAVGEAAVGQAKAAVAEVEAGLAVAQTAVKEAEALLRQDEIDLGYCTIKSPVAGVIIDRRVNVGQTVQSSFNTPSLFLIAKDLRRMQVWASVNEADIGQVRKGQNVRFTVDAHPRDAFHGTVSQIRLNATNTQNVVIYTVVIDTDNPPSAEYPYGKLLPYLTANLRFEVDKRENVLLVPNAALRWRPQLEQVAPDQREAYAKALRRKEGPAGEKESDKERQSKGTVWVEDKSFVRPIRLVLGLTDGNLTEVIKVQDGELPREAKLITGAAQQSGGDGTTNPFSAPAFGGGKKKE